MAYTILNTDGTTLLLLADGTVDKSATSLSLVGRNVNSYGEYLNNNLVKILANSASTSGNPPRSPLKGQLWYDTTYKRLKVYDNGFKNISGAIVASTQPDSLSTGDMWFDSTNNQMYVVSGSALQLIGPAFPKLAVDSGWRYPSVSVKNTQSNIQQVIFLKSYGQFLGMAAKTSFELSAADSVTYFGTSTNSTVVSGITINGDVKAYGNFSATGSIMSKHLSLEVDIDRIAANTSTYSNYNEYLYQNDRIKSILSTMFPVSNNTATNEVGLPLGAESRVLCWGRNGGTYPISTVQQRRFRVVNDTAQGKSWQAYNLYTTTWFASSLTNIMVQG